MDKTYNTILVIVTGLLVFYLIFENEWFVYSAVSIGVLSLLSAKIAELIVKAWFGIAQVLGYINSRIILSVIFFLILFPLSLLSRLTGKPALQIKRQDGSYFTDRNHLFLKEDFEKPW